MMHQKAYTYLDAKLQDVDLLVFKNLNCLEYTITLNKSLITEGPIIGI